jgi:hypothetical protein
MRSQQPAQLIQRRLSRRQWQHIEIDFLLPVQDGIQTLRIETGKGFPELWCGEVCFDLPFASSNNQRLPGRQIAR